MVETGLNEKFRITSLYWAYETLGLKGYAFQDKIKSDCMALDQMKICLGPYLMGIAIAILSIILENLVPEKDLTKRENLRSDGWSERRKWHDTKQSVIAPYIKFI